MATAEAERAFERAYDRLFGIAGEMISAPFTLTSHKEDVQSIGSLVHIRLRRAIRSRLESGRGSPFSKDKFRDALAGTRC